MLLTIITFLLVLSVLVLGHEWGHFWTARKFGVKAEEFGIGFPPRIFGFYKNREGKWKYVLGGKEVQDAADTIYSVNAIPIGGFVKIKGENGEDSDEEDSFASKTIWKRVIMISAGVVMNIILAAVLLSFGFMAGIPQEIGEEMSRYAKISERKTQVAEVLANSPAEKAGVEFGDTIISIDDKFFETYDSLKTYVAGSKDKSLTYRLKRGDEELTKVIIPEEIAYEDESIVGIGVGLIETGTVKYPFIISFWQGVKYTAIYTVLIIIAFVKLIGGLIAGQGIGADIAGPVGIAALTGQAARMGIAYLLQFAALLSINLAILNFFPFPALDGGRVIFLIVEKIRRKPVKKEVEALIHYIGFALLMLLVVFVTFKDIIRAVAN